MFKYLAVGGFGFFVAGPLLAILFMAALYLVTDLDLKKKR